MVAEPSAVDALRHRFVTLRTRDLTVVVVPTKGCDIIKVIDCRTGIDLMAKSPWGLVPPGPPPYLGSSLDEWLYRYGGGWQVLLPNGGDECAVGGTTFGFHGEAGLSSWSVDEVSVDEASFHVDLYTVPIRTRRTITVSGSQIAISESIENRSPAPVEVMWSHHPAFGAPLVEPGTRIEAMARSYWADPVTPGSVSEPGERMPWPAVVQSASGPVDLSVLPDFDRPRHVFGYLGDFSEYRVRIVNESRDLAATLEWNGDIFPHAWLWQELLSSPGYPWHQRLYTIAIEPATSVPGHGIANLATHAGAPFVLPANTTRTVHIELTTSRAEGRT